MVRAFGDRGVTVTPGIDPHHMEFRPQRFGQQTERRRAKAIRMVHEQEWSFAAPITEGEFNTRFGQCQALSLELERIVHQRGPSHASVVSTGALVSQSGARSGWKRDPMGIE